MIKSRNNFDNTADLLSLLLLAFALSIFTTAATAANNDNAEYYVDSIHSWGAWELDIEPAAGGIQPQATGPLNARNSRVTLRTNSIAALSPKRPPTPVITNTPTPIVPPAVPVIPTPPPLPPVPPGVGGPSDGLF